MANPDRIQGALYGSIIGGLLGTPRNGTARVRSMSDPTEERLLVPAKGEVDTTSVGVLELLIAHQRLDTAEFAQLLALGPRTDSLDNRSLLRVLPIALWHDGADSELAVLAMAQSQLTHSHPRVSACCALWALWVRRLLLGDGAQRAWLCAGDILAGCLPREARAELVAILAEDVRAAPIEARPYALQGSDHVVDSMLSARWAALRGRDYARAVRLAVMLGDHASDTGALAGGVAGLFHGIQGIPDSWIEVLPDAVVHRAAMVAGKLLYVG